MKVGDPINKLIHSSGEDILASYRTGQKAIVKDGKIIKIITAANHQEAAWQLYDWNQQEHADELAEEQKELDAFHKAAASEAAANGIIESQDLFLKKHLGAEAKKIIKKMLDQDEK